MEREGTRGVGGRNPVIWQISHRADPEAQAIADKHYSRQKPGTRQFVPPGRCLVLKAPGAYWVTSWPFAQYVKHRWPGAWVCSAFRRENHDLPRASDMIRDAVSATRWYWPDVPDLGMITFVDAAKVLKKRDPGRCFVRAGFIPDGTTKGGLLAFRISPTDMPMAIAPLFGGLRMEVRKP